MTQRELVALSFKLSDLFQEWHSGLIGLVELQDSLLELFPVGFDYKMVSGLLDPNTGLRYP